jgi:hypothetical protein
MLAEIEQEESECRTMVEIKVDKDKFDERVERMIHNAIDHAFGLKLKNIRPAGTEAIDSPT